MIIPHNTRHFFCHRNFFFKLYFNVTRYPLKYCPNNASYIDSQIKNNITI